MIYTDFVLRISLSLALGFLIGLERQAHRTSGRRPYQRSDLHGNQFFHVVSHAL